MCGLFGYRGPKAEPLMLQRLAAEASKRGPHSYGVLLELGIEKGPGRLSDAPGVVRRLQGSVVVGHCRLATSGDYADIRDAQPIDTKAAVVSHNGNIKDYRELARKHGLDFVTGCDSEAIGLLWAISPQVAIEALERNKPYAASVFDKKTRRLYLMADGLPLHIMESMGGIYYCSRPFPGSIPLVGRKEIA